MPDTKTKVETAILAQPGGTEKRVINAGEKVELTGNKQIDAAGRTWIEIKFHTPAGSVVQGWILEADTEQGEIERVDLSEDAFVLRCLDAESELNNATTTAPFFIAADYLIARAIIESALSNAKNLLDGTDSIGPFQMTSGEWARFLQEAPATPPFSEAHRDDPIAQIFGAAYSMHRDAKAISDLMLADGSGGTAADPFLPSYLDIFHCELAFNNPKLAVVIRKAMDAGDQDNVPITTILSQAVTQAEADALIKARSDTPTMTITLGQLVQRTEKALNDALKQAFDLIKKHAPDEVASNTSGEAPWLAIANAELAKNIAEPDPRIIRYFDATDFHPNRIEHWCGAFVAHCMKNCGDEEAAANIPKDAQRAANWVNFGQRVSGKPGEVPKGAVVVLSPAPGSNTSGHVAFFDAFTDNNKFVALLGGNQSDALKISKFPASQIRQVRWLDPGPIPTDVPIGGSGAADEISTGAFDLIVEFEVSSAAVYERKYRRPIWPGLSSGVTVGIGYDVGHTSAATVTADWQGTIADAMLNALKSAVGLKGAPAKNKAAQLHGSVDIPFQDAIKIHRHKVMPRWVAQLRRALPNTQELRADSLGALVSLIYNRGADFSSNTDKRKEMRNIKAHMQDRQFRRIPVELRAMKRHWPGAPGLQRRREAEARLFEAGLG